MKGKFLETPPQETILRQTIGKLLGRMMMMIYVELRNFCFLYNNLTETRKNIETIKCPYTVRAKCIMLKVGVVVVVVVVLHSNNVNGKTIKI